MREVQERARRPMRANSLGIARPAVRTPSAVPTAMLLDAGASAPPIDAWAWCVACFVSWLAVAASVVTAVVYLVTVG
jgi:hypothetical protein